MADFTLKTDADGIAVITWDCPGKSMNVMSFEGLRELEACIDEVLADDAIKGAVITSGKDSFAGGMDLNILAKLKHMVEGDPAKGVFDGVMQMHGLLRKIELGGMDFKTKKGGKPIVAANRGILPELVGHEQCGLVVDDTPDKLAAAIERMATDPELRVRLGRNAAEKAAEAFTLERQVYTMADLYVRLVERS